MGLSEEKFMLFTSFRRDGRSVAVPVWVVGLDAGTVAFTTGRESGKAKRIRHTARVQMQGCDRRGRAAHGPVYEGSARLVDGAELARIRTATRAKYGIQARIIGLITVLVARRRGQDDATVGVMVTLTSPAS